MEAIRFSAGNEIRFGQDMRFFAGIPSDVDFYLKDFFGNGSVVLVGDGHGAQESNGVEGRYGNGSIYVRLSALPEKVIQSAKEKFKDKVEYYHFCEKKEQASKLLNDLWSKDRAAAVAILDLLEVMNSVGTVQGCDTTDDASSDVVG